MSLNITKEVYLGKAKPDSGGGITPTGTINITTSGVYDVTNYASADVNVSAPGKYHLLDRVKDDNNNEIGTVVGFHYDANNTEYAVVCLDAQYRLERGQYLSDYDTITNLPQYANSSVYGAKETATFNCDKILAYVTAWGLTSTAVSHCRSKTFTVDSVQYAGQLPTLMELLKILEFMTEVNAADTSASQYSSLVLSTSTAYWSSSQNFGRNSWDVSSTGSTGGTSRNDNLFVAPVLEIPNA